VKGVSGGEEREGVRVPVVVGHWLHRASLAGQATVDTMGVEDDQPGRNWTQRSLDQLASIQYPPSQDATTKNETLHKADKQGGLFINKSLINKSNPH